jgi:ABC-type lipoprotein release transport system permease subunit
MTSRLGLLTRLGLRNVRRQRRRSFLTALAMGLGVAVLVFSRALGDGAHEDWIKAGVRLGSGHVAFQHPRFQASGKLEDRLSSDVVETAIAALDIPGVTEHVLSVAPRVEMQGLANSATAAVPVKVTGVVPDAEREFSQLADKLIDGRYLERGDRLHAYIGERLAKRLDLGVGSRLVLTGQDATGEIAGQFVRVVGIFRSGLPEADERIVHVPLETARDWLLIGDGVTTLGVLLHSGWEVSNVVGRLQAQLDDRTDAVRVLGWREAMPELDAAIKIDDYGDYIFHVILFALVALAIVNTVLMSVMHRTREFGVLRALGLTKQQTASVVFAEGVILTAVSGLVGMIVGFAFTWIFFRNGLDYSFAFEGDFEFSGVILDTIIIPEFRLMQVLQSLGSIFIVGVLASLYPAYRATRIDVAEAMKFEA